MLITKQLLLFAFCLSQGSALVCPKCDHAKSVNECVGQSDTCGPQEDVCLVKMQRWHFSMECSTTKHCQHAPANTTDCSGNTGFGPRDKCTICCTGQACVNGLRHLQEGIDRITNALHCPVCQNEADPQRCLDNFIPCTSNHKTCEVVKQNGLYTSRCAKSASQCLRNHNNANHLNTPYCIGATETCNVCCQDHDCLDYVFGRKSPSVILPLPNVVTGTSSTLTFSPPAECKDQSLFPCHSASDPCTDHDVSVELCPLTCGVCHAPTTKSTPQTSGTTTIKPTTVQVTTTKPSTEHHSNGHVATSTHSHGQVHVATSTHSHGGHSSGHHESTTQSPSITTVKSHGHANSHVGCPNGWTQFENSCYKHQNVKMTFTEAVEDCQKNNAYLMEITSPQENSFMKEFLNARQVDTGVWLGANDLLIEGTFVWDKSEQPMVYTDWSPGEPTGRAGGEDCLSSWTVEKYHWGDHFCARKDLGALCEMSVTTCP